MTPLDSPKSRHEGTVLKDKFTSEDIFERIIQVAGEEVGARSKELFFSALAAGFAITLTFFVYASMTAASGGHYILSALLYPLGFLYIVLGGYQLFTENTVPPVALAIERLASIPAVGRVWGVVLIGNLFGGVLGALVLATTNLFTPAAAEAAVSLSLKALDTGFWTLFVRATMAGSIVAGVVWLDYAMREGAARFFLVYLAFLTIPLTNLNHVVITATEAVYLFFSQGVSLASSIPSMVVPVLLGNALGGVLLVTFVNWFQTPHYVQRDPNIRLSWRDWLFTFKTFKDSKARS